MVCTLACVRVCPLRGLARLAAAPATHACVQAAALAVAAPLAVLHHIEARSRGAFLLRLPLLPIEAP